MTNKPDESALTDQDCNTLIEALDAWEHRDDAGDIMEHILLKSLPVDSEGARELDAMKAKRQKEKVIRNERSILLKAKLLRLRDSISAEQLANSDAP